MAAVFKKLAGDTLEGGGQLLRNAVAYSALLSKPIAVDNIRRSRDLTSDQGLLDTGTQVQVRPPGSMTNGKPRGVDAIGPRGLPVG